MSKFYSLVPRVAQFTWQTNEFLESGYFLAMNSFAIFKSATRVSYSEN